MVRRHRYDVSESIEAQFEPGSRKQVLKNLLGIKKKREMDLIEAKALKHTIDELMHVYDKGHRFIASDIQQIHQTWLGRIFKWAGHYRKVNLRKGYFPFASASQVPTLMAKFEEDQLRQYTPCNCKSKGRIIKALAEVHTELILMHPFREGNGRTGRILATLMATQAELPLLDFSPILGKGWKGYIAAIRAGLDKNYEPMEKIFGEIIYRTGSNV